MPYCGFCNKVIQASLGVTYEKHLESCYQTYVTAKGIKFNTDFLDYCRGKWVNVMIHPKIPKKKSSIPS